MRLSPIVVSALARRELLIAVSYRMSLLLTLGYGVLGLALYYFISRTFEGVSSSDLGAAPSYFAYAAVGIVVGTMVDATSSSVGTWMREEQTTGTLETLATTPMSSLELPVGVVSFPFLFATMQAGVYLLIASVWMSLDTSHTSRSGLTLVLVAAEPRSRRSACSPARRHRAEARPDDLGDSHLPHVDPRGCSSQSRSSPLAAAAREPDARQVRVRRCAGRAVLVRTGRPTRSCS